MKKKVIFIFSLLCLLVLGLLFLIARSTRHDQPPGLASDGTLVTCPDRPNCVSSEQGDVEPISFSETPEMAWKNIRLIIGHLGGTVVSESETYLAATFQSKIFGFVDDMEFRMIPEVKLIHVRSASRVGYNDMGTNRKRVEKFNEQFDLVD